MPSQWVIRRNGEGCDVLWREGLTPSERRERLLEMTADGQSSLEAEMELRSVEGAFTRCNTNRQFTRDACFDFVLSYAKPGDVLIEGGLAFVFMEPAKV